MNPWWLLAPSAIAALAVWSCWRESKRGDRYQAWMEEERIRADIAESRAAWLAITKTERDALAYALDWLQWPPDAAQMEILARCLGPSCQTPEHAMKAAIRGLLRRHEGADRDAAAAGE